MIKKNVTQKTMTPTPDALGMYPDDPMLSKVHAIENLKTEADAIAMADELKANQIITFFQLGGVLRRILEEHWFGKYGSFEELCLEKFDIRKTRAYDMVFIYKTFVEANIPFETYRALGWAKLRLLCSYAKDMGLNPKEFSDRLEKAKPLTSLQLKAELAPSLGGHVPSNTTTITFKPHADQLEIIEDAIDKSKKLSGTPYNTVALEWICIEYLNNPGAMIKLPPGADAKSKALAANHNGAETEPVETSADQPTIYDDESARAWMKNVGVANVLLIFESVFPDIDIEVGMPQPSPIKTPISS
jgi:hypothetical protein